MMNRPTRLRLAAAVSVAIVIVSSCGKPSIAGDAAAATTPTATTAAGMTSESPTDAEPEPTSEAPSESQSVPAEPEPIEPTEPTDAAPDTDEMYVYYVVETGTGFRLARELRDMPVNSDRLVAAVQAMIAGPEDPDYLTSWNPATTVLGVDVEAGHITVNLSGDATTANVGTAGAAIMVPQLVWTVTEASGFPDGDVTLQIDGTDVTEMWGAVSWDGPVTREQAEFVRMLVQIDTPREGARVTSPVTIAGDAAAFEANVPWRVLDADGVEVTSGFTMTSDGMAFSPYTFQVDLQPGDYIVEIAQDDPSDGEAGPPSTDTRRITVTG